MNSPFDRRAYPELRVHDASGHSRRTRKASARAVSGKLQNCALKITEWEL